MKIKNYQCKCGHNDFFFNDKGSQKGIYCSYCGKWLKWADKDEQNLAMKQEPFINKPCVSSGVCEHDKNKVLDKIRAEIKELPTYDPKFVETYTAYGMKQDVLEIIDKYKAETE